MTISQRTTLEISIIRGLSPHTRLHVLALLAKHPDLHVSSGRRTPAHNRSVGGVPNSWHLRGRGVDFTGDIRELSRALTTAQAQRVSPSCTGPEEAFVEFPRQPRQHLHVAW